MGLKGTVSPRQWEVQYRQGVSGSERGSESKERNGPNSLIHVVYLGEEGKSGLCIRQQQLDPSPQQLRYKAGHKVLTYVEYRAVSGVFQNIDPPPPLHHRVCPPPAPKAGRYTLAGR